MEKWRTAEREEAGGGDIFLMREAKDLSGKDGDLVLFEYIEEYPPLVAFIGMCSKIKNYYKSKEIQLITLKTLFKNNRNNLIYITIILIYFSL